MELLGQESFADFPDEFAMLEDVSKYLKASVFQIDNTFPCDIITTFDGSCYPVIQSCRSIVTFIGQSLTKMSDTFISTLMTKHRLFYYIVGSLFYKVRISSQAKIPHHEKTILLDDIIGFLVLMQESHSGLIGT